MSQARSRRLAILALFLAFLLHNDLWLWDEPGRYLGLPAGLTYHVLFCIAVSLLMALLVRYAWPRDDEADSDGQA